MMSKTSLYKQVANQIEAFAMTGDRCIFCENELRRTLTNDEDCPDFGERTFYDALAWLIEQGLMFVPQKDTVLIQLYVYLPVFEAQLETFRKEYEHEQRKAFS